MLSHLMQAVLGAEVPKAQHDGAAALGHAAPPSNDQVVEAAKKSYAQYQPTVDTMTLALVNLINTGSQRATISKLDGTNWASPGISAAIAEPLFACQDVQGAVAAARSHHDLNSLSVGVFSNELPGGGVGMIGFDRDLAGSSTSGLKLTLDLYKHIVSADVGSNLQLGVWRGAAGTLHDAVLGLYVDVKVQGVSVYLKSLLSNALDPYGFVISTGTTLKLPVQSGIFSGASATWQ